MLFIRGFFLHWFPIISIQGFFLTVGPKHSYTKGASSWQGSIWSFTWVYSHSKVLSISIDSPDFRFLVWQLKRSDNPDESRFHTSWSETNTNPCLMPFDNLIIAPWASPSDYVLSINDWLPFIAIIKYIQHNNKHCLLSSKRTVWWNLVNTYIITKPAMRPIDQG